MLRPRRTSLFLDLVLLAFLACLAGFITYRVTVHLDYTWHWGEIPQYILRHDRQDGRWLPNYLLLGLFTTLRLSVWGGLLALAIGLAMALARTGRSLYRQLIARTYVQLLRNLPPLVIIFLFYFFLADQVIPHLELDVRARQAGPAVRSLLSLLLAEPGSISAFLSAVCTLALFEGAYITEILRAGIESVDRGQWEAARALGLRRGQMLRHVILPQAVRRVLPALAGQFISLVKDSSIVSVISIQELTYQGSQLMASTYLTIEVWVTVALMYMLLTYPCSLLVSGLERRLARRT
ncbi:MAG TPA: amino acid ABC transporter permease [Desulfobulbus sp.]|nr:amino acid ABC transporter permease [Desulfobulbus sp.]